MLLLLDALALTLSLGISYHALKAGLHVIQNYPPEVIQNYVAMLAVSFLAAWILQPSVNGLFARNWKQEFVRILRYDILLALLFTMTLFLIKSPMVDSRYLFVYTMSLNFIFTNVLHYFYRKIGLRLYKRSDSVSLLGIVTTGALAGELIENVKRDYTRRVAGVILLDGAETGRQYGAPVLGGADCMTECIRQNALDEVLFHVPYEELIKLTDDIEEIKSMGTVVHLYVPLAEDYGGAARTVDMIGGCPVVSIAAKTLDNSALAVKRMCDVLFSVVGLLISAPVIALVALPLLLESRGPLFFSQKRVGRNGRVFCIYKLRSMYQDAEKRKQELLNQNEMKGLMFKMKDDPRITRVGRFIRKTSIDELPQLWNVLRGDMSLVGPRPPLLDEFEQYESRYKRRLSMRPGITGFWQVNGRNQVPDFEEVVRMDLAYIDNWSLLLDAKILLKTVGAVLSCTGR